MRESSTPASRDAELPGDAGEAGALGAQLDEFLNRLLNFHFGFSGPGGVLEDGHHYGLAILLGPVRTNAV